MRRLIPVLFLLLANCSLTTTHSQLTEEERDALTPQLRVYEVRKDYNRLAMRVDDYAKQPPCTETLVTACSDTEVVLTAYDWLRDADVALDEAEVIVRGGGATPEGKLSLSRDALRRLSTYLAAKQITEGVQ